VKGFLQIGRESCKAILDARGEPFHKFVKCSFAGGLESYRKEGVR